MAVGTDRFTLQGKVALVTGGSRGLGREMVLAFAEAGADVAIASRKQEACDELAAEVTKATGQRAVPIACHVGRCRHSRSWSRRPTASWGRSTCSSTTPGCHRCTRACRR